MFELFQSLRRRFGFGSQAARQPQVRLNLEALDDRIVPSTSPFSTANFATNSLGAKYAMNLQVNPMISPFLQFDPAPLLAATGTNAFTSTINLGLGSLSVRSQAFNNAAGVWNLLGTFESTNQIPIFGFNVSDDVGPLSIISGQIGRWPLSSGTAVFPDGISHSYYTNSISFQAVGDGMLTSMDSNGNPIVTASDHQTDTFTGSVLSVWVNGQAVPVGVSGTLDIKDHVTNIWDVFTNMTRPGPLDDDTNAVVPGMMFLGTTWASIVH